MDHDWILYWEATALGVQITVKRIAGFCAAVLATSFPPVVQAAEAFVVKEKHYEISGSTGIELYESVGRNSPAKAIAHTYYTIQWFKSYDRKNGSCRMTKARPEVVITYLYPKPGKLPPDLRRRWDTFIAGVRVHEEVHGRMIREMTEQSRVKLTGIEFAGDANCAKVKREAHRLFAEATEAYKANSREFDRVEQRDGGNVHRLVLALVNGD
jgi:predicted secreted Zn-dependent protease